MSEKIISKLDIEKLNCRDKAIVLLALSTDMSINTIMSLENRDFVEGLKGQYTEIKGDDIYSKVELESYLEFIGSFCLWEIEDGVGNVYVTASSPETNKAILQYMEYKIYKKHSIRLDDPLFDMEVHTDVGW